MQKEKLNLFLEGQQVTFDCSFDLNVYSFLYSSLNVARMI